MKKEINAKQNELDKNSVEFMRVKREDYLKITGELANGFENIAPYISIKIASIAAVITATGMLATQLSFSTAITALWVRTAIILAGVFFVDYADSKTSELIRERENAGKAARRIQEHVLGQTEDRIVMPKNIGDIIKHSVKNDFPRQNHSKEKGKGKKLLRFFLSAAAAMSVTSAALQDQNTVNNIKGVFANVVQWAMPVRKALTSAGPNWRLSMP